MIVEEAEEDLGDIIGAGKKGTQAYEGELNAMTFNHVKNSSAFAKKNVIDIFGDE